MFPFLSKTIQSSTMDISLGGVGVTYIDQGTRLNDSRELKAEMLQDNLYCHDLNCKNVWDKEVVNETPLFTVNYAAGQPAICRLVTGPAIPVKKRY